MAATAATPSVASFRGHRGAVNALLCDDDVHAHVLVSGGDDGTCRLWDVRSTRAQRCLHVKRALGLSPAADAAELAAVNALAFGVTNESHAHLHVATGNKVLTFDLRQDGLILDCTARAAFQDGDEEINHLSVHGAGKRARYLSAPDDNGEIRIYDLQAHRLFKTLRGQHSNLCMAAPFRPQAPWDLVTGGMDGRLLFWDFSRGRMKFCIDLNAGVASVASGGSATNATNATNEDASDATPSASMSTSSQLCNPPLVHSVAFAANGKSLAAALGDASVAVVDFASKQIVRRLRNHRALVSQVHFPAFQRDQWLLSAGNDCKVTVWDYVGALAREGNQEEGAHVVKDFDVADKPNAIATSRHQSLVHIADMGSIINAYPLL